MSNIEYNSLLFEISQRLDELNVLDRLLFMCRGKIVAGSEDDILDVLRCLRNWKNRIIMELIVWRL